MNLKIPELRHWLVSNWPIKLVALVLATVLWAVLAAQETTTQLVPVQLEVRPPEGRAFTSELPVVQARYAGPLRDLLRLYETPPTISADIPDTVTGASYTLELLSNDLQTDQTSVIAQEVVPSVIVVDLDDYLQRTVAVVPRIEIVTDSGYEVFGEIVLSPTRVTVRGPEARVGTIESLPTVPVEWRGVRAPLSEAVALDTAGLGVVVRIDPPQVQVSADVGAVSDRVIMGVSVTFSEPSNWQSDPSAVIVTVRGPSTRVLRMTRDSVRVVAQPSGSVDQEAVQLTVNAPTGIDAWATPDTTIVRRRGGG
jgi:YbbR domain-containing protein